MDWVRCFILFHGQRHPAEMGAPEIQAFLAHRAVEGNVSASTQNQALSEQRCRGALWAEVRRSQWFVNRTFVSLCARYVGKFRPQKQA